MMFFPRLFPCFLVLSGLGAAPALALTAATVVSVGDGDTFRAQRGDRLLTIRIACVDAPELRQQPYGLQSADRLKQLLPRGATVQLREVELDRNGRTVAEVFRNKQSIGLQMVKEGHAVVYPQYLENCADTQQQYQAAEAQAKRARLNFWKQARPLMPWDFRRGGTETATPSTTPRSNCSPAYPDVCIPPAPPDLDCNQISFRRFRVLPPDPHNFDGDRNGIGCER
ncbi:MAG: thermonuclease family protein [Leptolyngbyaceae cyanobacterium bins.59]|nr:thermonuclease family protein [Leptolyngbyaceae cyanobacterium bins.59]